MVINNFSGGIYNIRVDENLGDFEENEELIVNDKQIVSITEIEWKKIKENLYQNKKIQLEIKSRKNKNQFPKARIIKKRLKNIGNIIKFKFRII